ncbi:MAG: hypothetical protein N3A01_08605 [Bacteroidales bacterium]|nr:hypothetical protein [Bacteroidales bacterium]
MNLYIYSFRFTIKYLFYQNILFDLYNLWTTNVKSLLSVQQNGFQYVILCTKYSRSFTKPIYRLWNITYFKSEKKIWSFETVCYNLKNAHSDIQRFCMSNGLNLLRINRIFRYEKNYDFNLGMNIILAHPKNTIQNFVLEEYGNGTVGLDYLSAIAFSISCVNYFLVSKRFYFHLEARFNPSYSLVPIYNGKVFVKNFLLQIIGDIEFVFFNKGEI